MDEKEIIRRIVAGETALYRQLVDRYKDLSLTLAQTLLPRREDAEDVLQEAFLKAFKNLKSFRHRSSFATWLYRIVVHTSYHALERNQYRKTAALHDPKVSEPAAANDSYRELRQMERREIILRVLDQMKPQEALLLKLYYLGEQSVKEIGLITKLSPANIKVTLYRARQHFHAALDALLGDEKEHLL